MYRVNTLRPTAQQCLRSLNSTSRAIGGATSKSGAEKKPEAEPQKDQSNSPETKSAAEAKKAAHKASMKEQDEELMRRLEEMSGEGGASGLEYEDGKPSAMKRSVRNNMFRYI